VETLALRTREAFGQALKVAKFLQGHPAVAWLIIPGLESHPSHDLAVKYLKGKYNAILDSDQGRSSCSQEVHRVSGIAQPPGKHWRLQEPGDPSSRPRPTAAYSEEQAATGVTPDFIRVSVGIEDVEDIIADLDQALSKAVQ